MDQQTQADRTRRHYKSMQEYDSRWDLPVHEEMTWDIHLAQEFLKITDPDNSGLPEAYQLVKTLHEEQQKASNNMRHNLAAIPGPDHERERAYRRMIFQYHQWQIATRLYVPALKAANNNPMTLYWMTRYHHPTPLQAYMVDAVMKETVQIGLQELGRPASPEDVDKLWTTMNAEVDQITAAKKVLKMVEWAETTDLPRTWQAMEKVFNSFQNNSAWEVIDQYLTQPINALKQAQSEQEQASLLE